MDNTKIVSVIIILFLTLLSGFADSQGFIHASSMWNKGRLIWIELGKSALGFILGIATYWFVVKYLKELGILSPEIQTAAWFIVTIIGVAIISGKFLQWALFDQALAVTLLVGLTVLISRTGE